MASFSIDFITNSKRDADRLELHRIELLLLDQHLLADADLAEVVQQRGVADLAELIGREVDVAVVAVIDAIDDASPARR